MAQLAAAHPHVKFGLGAPERHDMCGQEVCAIVLHVRETVQAVNKRCILLLEKTQIGNKETITSGV